VFKMTAVFVNMYKNEGANETILPLFPAYRRYCELLWAFSTSSLKTAILSIGIEYTKSFMYPHKKRWHGNSLDSRSTPARFTTQHLCIQYSKMNAPFSQNFNLNHRINTYTPAFCSRIKLTKNVILDSAVERKKLYSKNTTFCADFTKTIISRSMSLG
jgi:hypothetical protein